jgi:hypothetical protein
VELVKPEKAESQPRLNDFGHHKCGVYGKMVMGYENAWIRNKTN